MNWSCSAMQVDSLSKMSVFFCKMSEFLVIGDVNVSLGITNVRVFWYTWARLL